MRTMADANIVIGILLVMNLATFAIGIWSDRKHRKDIAKRMMGLKFNLGTVHNVYDTTIFKEHTIVIYFKNKKNRGKNDMQFLSIDQALDLLKTRDLDKVRFAG